MMNIAAIVLPLALAVYAPVRADDHQVREITIFEQVSLWWDEQITSDLERSGYIISEQGRLAQRTVDLPPAPADQRDAQRIVATVNVAPRLVEDQGGFRPGDPWPRIGSVSVLVPDGDEMHDVEIMRFITGFGGSATYTQDVTSLAPLLHGTQTLRVMINTYADPAWEVSLTLRYASDGVGFRRPALVTSVMQQPQVTAAHNIVHATVEVPDDLQRPRLHIVSTGHATDGRSGDEFISRTHILRVNGEEIARWRPWAEQGNSIRHLNPASGRADIEGRELWSSDFDRSGWHPGLLVEPLLIPVPELTPGQHDIELEIVDIRPPDPDDEQQQYGYWRVSILLLADEHWPHWPGVRRGGRDAQ